MGKNDPTPMTKGDSQRIQSSQVSSCDALSAAIAIFQSAQTLRCKQAKGGKDMSSGGFAARAQAAGDKGANVAGGRAGAGTQMTQGSGTTGGGGQGGGRK